MDTPQHLVDALSPRKTQIIPLELMAAAGMLYTYGDKLRGKDAIFFIDNQSVCCALVKGCSRSWDIQLLATSWQLMCLQLGCRIWIEWVQSESNPADILSRAGETLYATQNGKVDPLLLPRGWMWRPAVILKKSLTPFEPRWFIGFTWSLRCSPAPSS